MQSTTLLRIQHYEPHFDQFCHDDLDSKDEIRLKKLIKQRFDWDWCQNFTPSRFNYLSLVFATAV